MPVRLALRFVAYVLIAAIGVGVNGCDRPNFFPITTVTKFQPVNRDIAQQQLAQLIVSLGYESDPRRVPGLLLEQSAGRLMGLGRWYDAESKKIIVILAAHSRTGELEIIMEDHTVGGHDLSPIGQAKFNQLQQLARDIIGAR
jgi:hypothetical protein